MASNTERTKILEMIASGTITAEEGLSLLSALDDAVGAETPVASLLEDTLEEASPGRQLHSQPVDGSESSSPCEGRETKPGNAVESLDSEEIKKWKRWWVLPLWAGTGVTVLSGLLMFWAYATRGFSFWFACTWLPFLLGVSLLALAWGCRTAPWLHVRVQQKPGDRPRKIAISFPIPVRLTAWGVRTFGRWIPQLDGTSLDEVILALKDISAEEAPLFVDVDEGEGGEKVQVFIG